MDPITLLAGGGLIVGVVAALWSRIKMLTSRVLSLAFVNLRVEGQAGWAVAYYCWKNFKRSPYGARRYTSFRDFVRSRARQEVVASEEPGSQPLVFWWGWRPLVVTIPTAGSDTTHLHDGMYQVWFVRGTFDADAFIADAVRAYNDYTHGINLATDRQRFRVVRQSGYRSKYSRGAQGMSPPTEAYSKATPVNSSETGERPDRRLIGVDVNDLGQPIPKSPMSALALSADVLRIVEDVRRWLASKQWYAERRIPWRMGVLLYGQPGTGKSSLVRAVAQELDLPVYSFDLSTFTNADFASAWQDVLTNAPCVALIEDLDAVFNGRDNVTAGDDGNALTFDCLLNCISGVADASGILTVITTNRVGLLDSAVGIPDLAKGGASTRPGRMDRAVQMQSPSEEGRRQIADRILAGYPDLVEEIVASGKDDTGAQFEDRCTQIALSRYWSNRDKA